MNMIMWMNCVFFPQISVVKDGSTLSECFHESVVLSEQTTDLDAVIQ